MRSFTLFLISIFLIAPSLSATTVSGEIGSVIKSISTPVSTSAQTQYQSGIHGTCYTFIKNKKTKKMVKRLVSKKYCTKK